MGRNTWLYIGLGIGAYFFLTSRQPVFQQQADGTYLPASILDKLTVALTGVQPPPQKTVAVNVPGLFNINYNPSGASSITAGG